MLPSGNDAAMALADWGGSVLNATNPKMSNLKAFIRRMNKEAKQLGMDDTHFENPHGLPHI